MHPQQRTIRCWFEEATVPACIPVRVLTQANGEGAAATRHQKGSGNIMVLNLIKPKDIPAIGQHLGTFLAVVNSTGKDQDGNEFNRLVVKGELDTTDKAAGKPFPFEKQYNLEGRGLAMFREDFRSWSGRKLTNQELAEFDPDKLMNRQRVNVVIRHRKDGKDTLAAVDTFLPAETPAQGNGN